MDKIEKEEMEFQNRITPVIDKIIALHDTFLAAFPDREDEGDHDLKLSIRAGITDFVRELKKEWATQQPIELKEDWMSVEDAPKINGEYNVVWDLEDGSNPVVTTMEFDRGKWIDTRGSNSDVTNLVLLWKELPEPPTFKI